MEVNNINCGIYRIKNLINKKVYIGLSKNIARRWEEHKIELNNNKKTSNYHFQGAWTLYGEENFNLNNNFSKVYVSIKFKVPGSVLNRILKQHSIETKKYKKPKNDEYFKNKLEKKRINNNEQLPR